MDVSLWPNIRSLYYVFRIPDSSTKRLRQLRYYVNKQELQTVSTVEHPPGSAATYTEIKFGDQQKNGVTIIFFGE